MIPCFSKNEYEIFNFIKHSPVGFIFILFLLNFYLNLKQEYLKKQMQKVFVCYICFNS